MNKPVATTVSIMFTVVDPDRAEKVHDAFMAMLEAIPDVQDAGSLLDAAGTDPLTRTRDLARSALSALRDLNNGYPWGELHVNVPQLLNAARELDCSPEADDVQPGEPIPDFEHQCAVRGLWIIRSSNGNLGINRESGAVELIDEDEPGFAAAYTGAVFDLAEYAEWAKTHDVENALHADGEADILDLACTFADGRRGEASDESRRGWTD